MLDLRIQYIKFVSEQLKYMLVYIRHLFSLVVLNIEKLKKNLKIYF